MTSMRRFGVTAATVLLGPVAQGTVTDTPPPA